MNIEQINRHIIKSDDGSESLFCDTFGETYHSTSGALQETEHIFIHNGLLRRIEAYGPLDPSYPIQMNILEYGFGTGLNILLTLKELLSSPWRSCISIRVCTLEKYPLTPDEYKALNYGTDPYFDNKCQASGFGTGVPFEERSQASSLGTGVPFEERSQASGFGTGVPFEERNQASGFGTDPSICKTNIGFGAETSFGKTNIGFDKCSGGIAPGTPSFRELYIRLHEAPWGKTTRIVPGLEIHKVLCDFRDFDTSSDPAEKIPVKLPWIDLVYFDAFSPSVQPEIWTPEIFTPMAAYMRKDAIFVTYSAKGILKQALRDEGLDVQRIPGAGGKRHSTVATKI